MRARVTARTSLFYGEEGEVLRSSHGLLGEPQFIVYLDGNNESATPFGLRFFGEELVLIDEGEAEDDDTIEAHYFGLERLGGL